MWEIICRLSHSVMGYNLNGLWSPVDNLWRPENVHDVMGYDCWTCTGGWTSCYVCITSSFFLWVSGVEVAIAWINVNQCRPGLDYLWDTIMAVDFPHCPVFRESIWYISWMKKNTCIYSCDHKVWKFHSCNDLNLYVECQALFSILLGSSRGFGLRALGAVIFLFVHLFLDCWYFIFLSCIFISVSNYIWLLWLYITSDSEFQMLNLVVLALGWRVGACHCRVLCLAVVVLTDWLPCCLVSVVL